MNLTEYYLAKCFDKQGHREAFINGSLFLHSTAYYWTLENTFQQDFEGMIFHQTGKGYLIAADSEFKKLFQQAESLSDIVENMEEHGKILSETTEASFYVNGYLSCFYLLPKNDVHIENGTFEFTMPEAKRDLLYFFQKYLEGHEHVFPVLCDARRLCNCIMSHFEENRYDIAWGSVEYKELELSERLTAYRNRKIEKIVFTKPLSYQYQREFRIFICPKSMPVIDPFVESGVDIASSVVGTVDYFNDADI